MRITEYNGMPCLDLHVLGYITDILICLLELLYAVRFLQNIIVAYILPAVLRFLAAISSTGHLQRFR